MPLSMYQASVPVFAQVLTNLSGILTKGAAHAVAKKIDPAVMLGTRLIPDMFPLLRQVQIATDHAKGACARLGGRDVPAYPDTETDFEQLQARIQKTLNYVRSYAPADIDGSEDKEIVLTIAGNQRKFKGQTYLLFHATTAYNILRGAGVEIGKRDFIGTIPGA
ncbi:MAG: DUF1993 domain-containing protein [Alphaproteobacteria bacterium]|nr:DUF1993 domain-containing protein [Alphaproteobacteria bacterium]